MKKNTENKIVDQVESEGNAGARRRDQIDKMHELNAVSRNDDKIDLSQEIESTENAVLAFRNGILISLAIWGILLVLIYLLAY